MTDIVTALTSAARQAGERVLAAPRPPLATTAPEFLRVFREFDDRVAGPLTARLAEILPGVPVVDDLGGQLPEAGEAWVVDAVDGAVQYMHGLPQWCVSAALVRDGTAVAAVVHSPLLGETYAAAAGSGATRNGVPLRPAATAELRVALLATSHPPFAGAQPAGPAGASVTAVLPRAGAVRNLGPTSWQVADVAGGRIDGFWMFGRDPGNLVGAALIAREAGLPVTDAAGRDWTAASGSFLVAAPALHGPLRDLLAAVEPARDGTPG